MSSIFSKIIAGEIPCHKVAEDDKFIAFLDINPVQSGHTLVVPKKEQDYIFDLSDKDLCDMMIFAKSVAARIQKVTRCRKVAITVIGLEVPHAHMHLIPINKESDLNFKKKMETDHEALAQLAEVLRHSL